MPFPLSTPKCKLFFFFLPNFPALTIVLAPRREFALVPAGIATILCVMCTAGKLFAAYRTNAVDACFVLAHPCAIFRCVVLLTVCRSRRDDVFSDSHRRAYRAVSLQAAFNDIRFAASLTCIHRTQLADSTGFHALLVFAACPRPRNRRTLRASLRLDMPVKMLSAIYAHSVAVHSAFRALRGISPRIASYPFLRASVRTINAAVRWHSLSADHTLSHRSHGFRRGRMVLAHSRQ